MRGKIVGLCHVKGTDKETNEGYEYVRIMCTYKDASMNGLNGENVYSGYLPNSIQDGFLKKYPEVSALVGKTVYIDFTPKGRISEIEIQ